MIRLNRQFQDGPTLFDTFLFNKGVTLFGDLAPKHRFPALRAPDQVIHNQVDAVFISYIVHVEIITKFDIYFYKYRLLKRRLKPEKAPNHYHSNGVACGGLKPISVNQFRRE